MSKKLQPELATSWRVTDGGRKVTFQLREGVVFSDGTPFTADDVVHTFKVLMDPKIQGPFADAFRSDAGGPVAQAPAKYQVTVSFPAPMARPERLFDPVAILSARSPLPPKAGPGPFLF